MGGAGRLAAQFSRAISTPFASNFNINSGTAAIVQARAGANDVTLYCGLPTMPGLQLLWELQWGYDIGSSVPSSLDVWQSGEVLHRSARRIHMNTPLWAALRDSGEVARVHLSNPWMTL